MDSALALIDSLIADHPDDSRLTELRELVAEPSLDDLERIIENIASTKVGKIKLMKRGKPLIKKIMGK